MAELAATKTGPRAALGPYFQQAYRATAGNVDDEWIVTEFRIDMAVVGVVVLGAAGATHSVRTHRLGTGDSEATQQGALGIRTNGSRDVLVTVRGR